MNETDHILFAYELSADGKAIRLSTDEISQEFRPKATTWVHLDHRDPETEHWIARNLEFLHPTISTALMAEDPRPRLEEFDDGLLVLLRAANLNVGDEPHDMISVRLWIDSLRIITLQGRTVRAIGDVEARLLSGRGPKTSGDFLALLNSFLVDRMEGVISLLDETTDALEEHIMENPHFEVRKDIVSTRQKAIMFRRYIVPQRDVLLRLRALDHPLIQKQQKMTFQECLDHLSRFIEDLDAIRERSQVVQDELTNALADKLNKRMYMLSIIAAVFLPLGFFTGLLGINVAGIPGSDYHEAFLIVCGMVVVIVGAQVAFFKWMKWF